MIIDHKYNELYKNKQQLVQELQTLNKKEGKEQEKKNLQKQLNQAEKKFNDYLEKRKERVNNPYLFSKVEQLEKELTEIKKTLNK